MVPGKKETEIYPLIGVGLLVPVRNTLVVGLEVRVVEGHLKIGADIIGIQRKLVEGIQEVGLHLVEMVGEVFSLGVEDIKKNGLEAVAPTGGKVEILILVKDNQVLTG